MSADRQSSEAESEREDRVGLSAIHHDKTDRRQSSACWQEMRIEGSYHSSSHSDSQTHSQLRNKSEPVSFCNKSMFVCISGVPLHRLPYSIHVSA